MRYKVTVIEIDDDQDETEVLMVSVSDKPDFNSILFSAFSGKPREPAAPAVPQD